MHRIPSVTLGTVLIAVVALLFSGMQAQQPARSTPQVHDGRAADVTRGKYLVENVAMCGECHTPRDSNGALDRTKTLAGAPVILRPPNPDPNWPLTAPRIGGTPPASDADMVKLLTTGIWTTGKPL